MQSFQAENTYPPFSSPNPPFTHWGQGEVISWIEKIVDSTTKTLPNSIVQLCCKTYRTKKMIINTERVQKAYWGAHTFTFGTGKQQSKWTSATNYINEQFQEHFENMWTEHLMMATKIYVQEALLDLVVSLHRNRSALYPWRYSTWATKRRWSRGLRTPTRSNKKAVAESSSHSTKKQPLKLKSFGEVMKNLCKTCSFQDKADSSHNFPHKSDGYKTKINFVN